MTKKSILISVWRTGTWKCKAERDKQGLLLHGEPQSIELFRKVEQNVVLLLGLDLVHPVACVLHIVAQYLVALAVYEQMSILYDIEVEQLRVDHNGEVTLVDLVEAGHFFGEWDDHFHKVRYRLHQVVPDFFGGTRVTLVHFNLGVRKEYLRLEFDSINTEIYVFLKFFRRF